MSNKPFLGSIDFDRSTQIPSSLHVYDSPLQLRGPGVRYFTVSHTADKSGGGTMLVTRDEASHSDCLAGIAHGK